MKPKVRRHAVVVGASAGLGFAGCGGAASSSQNPGAQPGTSPGQSNQSGSSAYGGAQALPGPGGRDRRPRGPVVTRAKGRRRRPLRDRPYHPPR